MNIAIDFDGTVVTHEYPNVGVPADNAVEVLDKIITAGHNIILFTMRSGKELQDAVDWYKSYNIPLFGINTNPNQLRWTSSPKAWADLYIDDCGINCPVRLQNGFRVVDWKEIEKILFNEKY